MASCGGICSKFQTAHWSNQRLCCRGVKEVDAAYFQLVEPANSSQASSDAAGTQDPWKTAEGKHIVDLLLACLEGDLPSPSG